MKVDDNQKRDVMGNRNILELDDHLDDISIDEVLRKRGFTTDNINITEFYSDNTSVNLINKTPFESIKYYLGTCFRVINVDVDWSTINSVKDLVLFITNLSLRQLNNFEAGNDLNINYQIDISVLLPSINISITRRGTYIKLFECNIYTNSVIEDKISTYSIKFSDNLYNIIGLHYYEKITYELRDLIVILRDNKIEKLNIKFNRYIPVPSWLIGLYIHLDNKTKYYLKELGYEELYEDLYIKEDLQYRREVYLLDDIYTPLIYKVKSFNTGLYLEDKRIDIYKLISIEHTRTNNERYMLNNLLIYYNLFSEMDKNSREHIEMKLRREYQEKLAGKNNED